MADQIVYLVVEKDGLTVIKYSVTYEVVYEMLSNSFCVTVRAEEMVDPTDQAEAIIKANVQAKVIKDDWIARISDVTSEGLITEPQTVVLE